MSGARAVRALLLFAVAFACAPASAQPTTSPKGYIEMPKADDGAWVLTSRPGSGRNWGRPVFIRYLVLVAREWKRRHPEAPVLRLGDLSKPDGSNFPPHKTHKDGLTADIFTSPKNICHVRYANQDLTLELAQLMYDLGARQILYNGEKVTKAISVAQKWPKHDDHFHVVIDPARVPAEGSLLILPQPDSADGVWIPRSRLKKKDLTGLRLSWRVLGKARLRGFQVLFDDMDDKNGVLHDSELVKKRRPTYKLPIPLEHGKRYRWRVILKGKQGDSSLGWQSLRTDLEPPTVTAVAPTQSKMHDHAPTLEWRYTKPSVAQASYRIELDNDPSHRKLWRTLGPFKGAASRHALDKKLFRRSKRYHWRVVAVDAHGNEAASSWETFKTSVRFGKGEPPPSQTPASKTGRVTANALNLRGGPGTGHPVKGTLKKGDQVRVVGERDGWLEVESRASGKPVRGFVSKKYITLD